MENPMKHSVILPIIFFCIPAFTQGMEPDTGQTPPPGWNPGGSDALREWLTHESVPLLMSTGANQITIKSYLEIVRIRLRRPRLSC
jgi:hypothetical protein